MKQFGEVEIGDPIISNGKLMLVSDVVYKFAGYLMPKPAIEAKIVNPQTVAEHKVQRCGSRWEYSAIYNDDEIDEVIV
jgi:hypothetical protein